MIAGNIVYLSTVDATSGVRQYLRAGVPEVADYEDRGRGMAKVERSLFLTDNKRRASFICHDYIGALTTTRISKTGKETVLAQIHPYYGYTQFGRPLYIKNDYSHPWTWDCLNGATTAKFRLRALPTIWLGIRDGYPTLVPEEEAIAWDIDVLFPPLPRSDVISTPVTVSAAPLLTAVIEAEDMPPPPSPPLLVPRLHLYSF